MFTDIVIILNFSDYKMDITRLLRFFFVHMHASKIVSRGAESKFLLWHKLNTNERNKFMYKLHKLSEAFVA